MVSNCALKQNLAYNLYLETGQKIIQHLRQHGTIKDLVLKMMLIV